jgi:tetratricopeptide (TPR) repeat protein
MHDLSRSSCPDEAAVLAFARGRGNAGDRADIESHVDHCAACLELIVHAARAAADSPPTDAGGVVGGAGELAAGARYQLGKEIARGGMGRIFEAYDLALGRTVAIKCLREDRSAMEARFEREVALTAQLEHPAIVAVHDAGRLPDGRRFYAMRRIGGKPLDQRIAEAPDLNGRLALLPYFIALVDAMAYVHSRSVIHRDLKPQNVVVGEFGETVIVDWGLAKRLADSEPESAAPASLGEVATLDGEIVGTRGYMAPEQATGGNVGLAADVHGLGATLLHLITGHPPALGTNPATIAELKEAPPELAAIAIRAMARDPAARYPSARELSEDLHRFHTGRLVEAHQYSIGQLARRWFARHRKMVMVATLSLLAIAGIAIVAVVRVVDERETARAERGRAEEHRDAAQQLVAFILDKLHHELADIGRLDLLASTAHKVVDYYDHVQDDSKGTLHRAMALGVLAQTQSEGGDAAGALVTDRDSVLLARVALALAPTPGATEELGHRVCELGETARELHAVDAAPALHECEELARGGLAADPASVVWQTLLATAWIGLADEAYDHGDLRSAEDLLRRAIELAQRLGASDARGWRIVIHAGERLVMLYVDQGRWDEASGATDVMRAAALRLDSSSPADGYTQFALAAAWLRIGDVRQHQRKLAEADAAFGEAYRICTAQVAFEPRNAKWQELLGTVAGRLGDIARERGDNAKSLEYATLDRDSSRRLLERDRHNPMLVHGLATAELHLGDAHGVLRADREARAAFERALQLYLQLERDAPSPGRAQEVATVWLHIGDLEQSVGHLDAANAALERALDILRKSLAEADVPFTRQAMASALLLLADVVPARASATIAQAAEVMAPLRGRAATDPSIRGQLDEIDRRRGKR